MSVFERVYRRLLPASAAPQPRFAIDQQSPARIERILPAPEEKKLPIAELERLTAQIPSMGGTEIGAQLREAARRAPSKTSIVEVGSWLGAGTAQLALGVRERGAAGSVAIHCYDRWEATETEIAKAAALKNLRLVLGEDTLPWVKNTLRPFGVAINFVKCDLREATWSGGPISVYVDDAAKTPQKFFHALKTFGPHWIPGTTIVILMDYHYWEKTGLEKHKGQKRFIENHPRHFEHVEGFRTGSCDAFIYRERLQFDVLRKLF